MDYFIDPIIEKISFTKKVPFRELLNKSISVVTDEDKKYDCLSFKLLVFFKGFPSFQNELGKGNKYLAGVEALSVICEVLNIEIEKEECFILYHIRDAGKFKVREKTLHAELKKLWTQHKDFALSDNDFSYALKNLMRNRFISYRRGGIQLSPNVLLRIQDQDYYDSHYIS